MSNIDIVEKLHQEFQQPLRNGEKRRIIFWNDYDKEFGDSIDEVHIEGVRVHKLKPKNNFYTKYLIEEEDTTSNFLIYNTVRLADERDNWLLDMMLYSFQFYADKTSLIMNELQVDVTLRKTFTDYKEFFNAEDRIKKFSRYGGQPIDQAEQLELYILAAITGAKSTEFEEILRMVFIISVVEDDNKYYQAFEKYNMEKAFWKYAHVKYGYSDANKSLRKLFIYIVSTVLASSIKEEKLSRIKPFIGSNKPNCIIFIDHWLNHSIDHVHYDQLSEEYEQEINMASMIEKMQIDEYQDVELLRVFDRAIITYIVNCLENKMEDYDQYIEIIRGRRTKHFYKDYRSVYEAAVNAIEMYKFYKKYNSGIPPQNNAKFFKAYAQEYYKVDAYYRKFYYYHDQQPESQAINKLKTLVENLYVNWFLPEIGVNWTSSIDHEMKKAWTIPGVTNQREFYNKYVTSMVAGGDRVFVIVSDALRYEVGAEIADRLNEEVINSTTIHATLSSVPSITKLGMAALLPHQHIEMKDDGRVFVDSVDSSGLDNRNKILQKKLGTSIAVDYQRLPKNKIDFIETLKGYKLIYIYHDTIDATADKGATEYNTFDVAQKAIDEIMDLIHKITDWLGGINVVVTADHGFIYQRSKLDESDKIDKEAMTVLEKGRRYMISKEDMVIDNLVKVDMSYLLKDNGAYTYLPKAHIRFKVQGEGANYVHGGASLQELMVPVVVFKNIRSNYKKSVKAEKVKVKLTNEIRKITNSIFMVNFFQTEKISEKITPATLDVYMEESTGNVISSIETIIADLTSERPEERIIKIKLTLKAMNYDKNRYYQLIVKDKETAVVVEEIPFTISLGIASDFDF